MNEGKRVADLRFRFGTRDLTPKLRWLCPQGCEERCGHEGSEYVLHSEDGAHITLQLEHGEIA